MRSHLEELLLLAVYAVVCYIDAYEVDTMNCFLPLRAVVKLEIDRHDITAYNVSATLWSGQRKANGTKSKMHKACTMADSL